MAEKEISPFSKKLTILIGLSVVGAMAFGLSISFYHNLLFEETLSDLGWQNRELRRRIDAGLDELAYYRSRQYRDKYAKENLGRLNPGEKVLIFTEQSQKEIVQEEGQFSMQEERESAYKHALENIPVLDHWRLYIFDPDGLQKLKQSF